MNGTIFIGTQATFNLDGVQDYNVRLFPLSRLQR